MTDVTTTHEVALDALARAQETHVITRQLIERIDSRQPTAADQRLVVLDADKPVDRVQGTGASLGVLNPNPVTIYVGVGGTMATPAGRGIPVPPNSLLVWPVDVTNVELGVDKTDPLLGADQAVVHVLLFASVQAAFVGSL